MRGVDLTDLASAYGTPLYVTSEQTLRERARELLDAFRGYTAPVRIHYSYKTNSVEAVLRVLRESGIGAEVVSGYELWLAQRLGLTGSNIVFNGPLKRAEDILTAIQCGASLIVADGDADLRMIEEQARAADRPTNVALRICPDVIARGMNASSLTGSRRAQFGWLQNSEELRRAVDLCIGSPHIRLRAFHAHIGSGIHDMGAFEKAARRLLDVYARTLERGADLDTIDLGGGLGARTSREFTTVQFLLYLALGKLPRESPPAPADYVQRYANVVLGAITDACHKRSVPLPSLVLEPGRVLVSDSTVLLLTVAAVRERRGIGRFAITDGGAMSTSLMFLSEYHAVRVANRDGEAHSRVSIFGGLPSPMDVVYRNLRLPPLQEKDVLAVMDAGAYFTSTASNFAGPRAPIVMLRDDGPRLVRRRETYEDMVRAEERL